MKLKNYLTEIFIEDAKTDKEMLRVSIIAELDAANLYERFASQTDDEQIKKVMLDIAEEEKVHAGEFESLLKKIDPNFASAKKDGYREVEDMEEE